MQVWLVINQTSDVRQFEAFTSEDKAIQFVKELLDDYSESGIVFESFGPYSYHNDFHETYIEIETVTVKE